jgi:hypothetical protein
MGTSDRRGKEDQQSTGEWMVAVEGDDGGEAQRYGEMDDG